MQSLPHSRRERHAILQQYTSVPTIEHLEEEGGIELEVRKADPGVSSEFEGNFEEAVVNVAKRARANLCAALRHMRQLPFVVWISRLRAKLRS